MKTTDTTIRKIFANISDLLDKTKDKIIYVELSCGYFIPTTEDAIRIVADSMTKFDDKFCGEIIYMGNTSNVQVKINK